jgi:membrane fusion protein (multidrug efflux system)
MKEQASTSNVSLQEQSPLEQTPPTEEIQSQQAKQFTAQKNNKKSILVLAVVGIVGTSILGWKWIQDQMTYVTTDNAQIQGHISPISSRVSGMVEKIWVSDGNYVKAGDPLILLESKDLSLGVKQAQANLDAARARLKMSNETVGFTKDTNQAQLNQVQESLTANQAAMRAALSKVEQAKANVEVAKAKITKAQTQVNKARSDWNRYRYLSMQGAVSTQQKETAWAAFKDSQAEFTAAVQQAKEQYAEVITSQAQYQQALAQIRASQGKVTETKVAGQQVNIQLSQSKSNLAQVYQAEAALALVKQQLSYTLIKSPVTGYVGTGMGQLTVQVGQMVQPNQPLLSVVPLSNDQIFVEANYKETDLQRVKIGSPALIEADAYPGKEFQAVVAGISPATGAQFALIPPDNATGNFNKIVQWVPVRLVFKPGTDPNHQLRAGLSVRVKIDSTSH